MAIALVRSLLVNDAGSDQATLTSSSFTPTTGNILVVKYSSADTGLVPGTPTGGGWTYTKTSFSAGASHCYVSIWTATVGGSPASQTVALTSSGSNVPHSMVVEEWSGAQLAATPATNATKTGTGAPSATLSTVANNSVVTSINGDWAAVAPGTPAYLSSALEDNGGAPNGHLTVSGQYTAYYFYQTAATLGSQTIGLTAPTGQTWSMVGIEIEATGATAPNSGFFLFMQ